MFKWLIELFIGEEEVVVRKTRVRLSSQARMDVVTDIVINKIKAKTVARLYDIDVSTVYKIVKRAKCKG
jgi:hypothetical protein